MGGKRDGTANVRLVNLRDIADIEGCKKNKIYKKGSILFPTSAAIAAEIKQLEHDSVIDDRYAVATIKDEFNYNDKYIFIAIERMYYRWLHGAIQNINLPWGALLGFKFEMHMDKATQDKIVEDQERIERMINAIEREIELEQELKKTMLRKMFP